MRRVSVVGSSGAGKSTVGRALAEILDVPFTELDAVRHGENWTTIEPEEFARRAEQVAATDAWVVDGNDEVVVSDGPIWRRADTVVWLDVPRRVAMWQVTRRTIGRAITREELWHGNRGGVVEHPELAAERSMIRWVWTTHAQVRDHYERLARDPAHHHLRFVRLRSRAEIDRWLAAVSRRFGSTDTG